MVMMTITLSGTPGTGKTTVAKLLKKKLGLKHVYTGALFRKMATDHHMTLGEFGRYCETHKDIDLQLDDHQVKLLRKGDIILEGRLAGWLAYRHNIPATKILLHADLETRARRIVNREQGAVNRRKQEILNREKSEETRYKKYYNIDLTDTTIYDVVIDSSDKTPKEIVDIIVNNIPG
jgi:predicted cytidylate kinase